MINGKTTLIFFVIFLVALFFGAVFGATVLKDDEVSSEPTYPTKRDTHKKDGIDAEIYQYKKGKCLIINRLDCPPGWGPITVLKCEDKLEKCENNYETLQKFCNVNCEDDLEACQQDLQYVRENCFYSKMGLYL